METGHLKPEAVAELALPAKERIRRLGNPHWISYPAAVALIGRLQGMLEAPRTERMRNLVIHGPTNNGKTSLVRRFEELNPPDPRPESEASGVPVVRVQVPAPASEGSFYDAILAKFTSPARPRDPAAYKRSQVVAHLAACQTRILILDEIHHLLATDRARPRAMASMIKSLGNELQMPVAVVGTPEALAAIRADDQLSNRFHAVFLGAWKYGTEFRQLLAGFERVVPLGRASGLADTPIARRIHQMSEGLIGEVSTIIELAAAQAIQTGGERIDLGVLKEIEWVAPSLRRAG